MVLLIFVVANSCGKDSSCFKNTGKIITEQRAISSEINSIKTADNIDIIITQSDEVSLIVEGGANLLPYVKTEVSGNQLSISSDNKCGLLRDYTIPITVYLSLPNIGYIDYTGQGNISSTNKLVLAALSIESTAGTGNFNLNVEVDDLAIRQHSGPSDFTISGKAKNSYVYTLGNGWFHMSGLQTEKSHVSHGGSGRMIVNASNSLLVELYSTGDINYYGNPTVTISVHNGLGNLVQK